MKLSVDMLYNDELFSVADVHIKEVLKHFNTIDVDQSAIELIKQVASSTMGARDVVVEPNVEEPGTGNVAMGSMSGADIEEETFDDHWVGGRRKDGGPMQQLLHWYNTPGYLEKTKCTWETMKEDGIKEEEYKNLNTLLFANPETDGVGGIPSNVIVLQFVGESVTKTYRVIKVDMEHEKLLLELVTVKISKSGQKEIWDFFLTNMQLWSDNSYQEVAEWSIYGYDVTESPNVSPVRAQVQSRLGTKSHHTRAKGRQKL